MEGKTIHCPNCQGLNKPGDRFCRSCGKPLPKKERVPQRSTPKSQESSGIFKPWVIISIIIVVLVGLFLILVVIPSKTTTTETLPSQNSPVKEVTVHNRPDRERYKGDVGGYPITMEMYVVGDYGCARGGARLEGSYYYDRYGSSNSLSLKGYACGASITLDEYNKNGTKTGTFVGISQGHIITGVWKDVLNRGTGDYKELEFQLSAS